MKKQHYNQAYYEDIVEQSLKAMSGKYRKFLSYVKPGISPAAVVDLGSGSGTLCAYLKSRFPEAQIVGLEKFEIPLKSAIEKYPGLDFQKCDLEISNFPIKTGSIDLLVSHEVIEHLQSIEHFLQESLRILKPGGVLLLKTPNRLDAMRLFAPMMGKVWYADEDKTHVQYFDVSVKKLLLQYGFSSVKAKTGTKPLCKKGLLRIPALPFLGNGLVVIAKK